MFNNLFFYQSDFTNLSLPLAFTSSLLTSWFYCVKIVLKSEKCHFCLASINISKSVHGTCSCAKLWDLNNSIVHVSGLICRQCLRSACGALMLAEPMFFKPADLQRMETPLHNLLKVKGDLSVFLSICSSANYLGKMSL